MSVRPPSIFLAVCFAVISACNKDDLTVVSTVSASTNTCGKYIVELNVDSLFNDPPSQPWESDIEIQMCACDTLVLQPVNIPFGFDFERWTIDQGGGNMNYNELVLDSITVSSDLELEFQRGMGHMDLHVDIVVTPCK